ncbi:MAG: hypothetical protein ACYC5M_00880 [Anaerolineae bacterium]
MESVYAGARHQDVAVREVRFPLPSDEAKGCIALRPVIEEAEEPQSHADTTESSFWVRIVSILSILVSVVMSALVVRGRLSLGS